MLYLTNPQLFDGGGNRGGVRKATGEPLNLFGSRARAF